jgi:hypothetical protein
MRSRIGQQTSRPAARRYIVPMRRPAWLPLTLILATTLSLTYWLWSRTGEIILDFGNELYTAWQLSQGKVLYRDVACLYGPLSPTLNAAVMRIFGPSLNTILTANLIILILTTLMLHQLLRIMSSALAAATGTIFFLCIFALSAPTRLTNYNFLTPYAHQITHGFLLCLAAIWCIDWFYRTRSSRAAIAGGLLTGLTFLTKPEIFLGCAAAYFLGLFAAIWLTRPKRITAIIVVAVISTALPPLIAFLYFASKMPAHAALDGVLSGWQFVNNPSVLSTPFYKGSFGTDQPITNSLLMLEYAGIYAVAAAALAFLATIAVKLWGRRQSIVFALVLGAVACLSLLQIGNQFASFWADAGRGLPLFAIFAAILTFRHLANARDDQTIARRALLQWTLAILSLSFLAKIFLFARLYQYGFVLAVPCAMLAVIGLIDWLPNWIQKKSASPAIIQMGAIGFFAALIIHNLAVTQRVLSERTLSIPLTFGGTAWTRPTNSASVVIIRWLTRDTRPTDTIAIIPDAAGINYAAGRSSSVPYTEMHPMGLNLYGESNVTFAFNNQPPDYILIMDFSETAFGARTFGRDYGLDLSSWIAHHYRPIAIFSTGDHPIYLWRHLPADPAFK